MHHRIGNTYHGQRQNEALHGILDALVFCNDDLRRRLHELVMALMALGEVLGGQWQLTGGLRADETANELLSDRLQGAARSI